jgi:alkylhydroperoxidase/carboxymuconolactone decarboxylase family protein YurZ
MPDPDAASRRGLAVKRRLFGAGKEHPLPPTHLAGARLRLTDELVFGRLYTRPARDLRTRSMLTVAALAVPGGDADLRRHLQGALHVGVSLRRIREMP